MYRLSKIIGLVIICFGIWGFTSLEQKKSLEKDIKLFVESDTLTWKLLGEIRYMKKKHATYGEVEFPIINAKLKNLNGKSVVMKGFIVPIDNKNYAISKNVFAACFFCGKAGPETIMGLKFKKATPKLKTDTYLVIKGKLRCNETDVEDWIYNIDNAEIVGGL
jgi:hypothetical protein